MTDDDFHRFSVSQIAQGPHKFFTLTIPSDVLAKTCFVSTREEEPLTGFQRVLDVKRAKEIARYIDSGFGTIPSSIVLSAQPEALLELVGRGKTLQFSKNPKSFLILDGQHRVFGFSMAEANMRVPVVIYNGLSRKEESRLFIDINSKQRGVPNELLLDIKKLAEIESDQEELFRALFDRFNQDSSSPLFRQLSPAVKARGKLSRQNFNSAMKIIYTLLEGRDVDEIYPMLNSYFVAMDEGLTSNKCGNIYSNTVLFKAVASFFPNAASKVKDRFGIEYTVNNFYEVLTPMFSRLKPSKFSGGERSYRKLADYFDDCMKTEFSLF